ncbi:MAG: hypothetical protein U0235_16825 [Polyangiaceae bacterium]
MADSKFAQLLAAKKIDPRRLIAASHKLETLKPEDRAIKHAKRKGKGSEDASAPKETRKPRSGRPVTQRAMDAAMKGGTVSGPTKNRILRALNAVLAQKKQEPVDLRAIF